MIISDCIIVENELLSKHTSMKVGGGTTAIFPSSSEGLINAVKALKGEKFIVLGNGSNVLFPDKGYGGYVIITSELNDISLCGNILTAQCGATLSRIATVACESSLSGLEFSYGIPGTVGGGVFMNAGAYGGEIKDVLKECICINEDGEKIVLAANEMELSYRSSMLQRKKLFLLSAVFSLSCGEKAVIKEKMQELMCKRREKQPLEYPSCGSFFKRPEGYFAGKLIEDAGLKGFSVGDAAISEKHCGFVINKGNATTADILKLSEEVSKRVFEKFGVVLQREVRVIEE